LGIGPREIRTVFAWIGSVGGVSHFARAAAEAKSRHHPRTILVAPRVSSAAGHELEGKNPQL
jgi:hypothetical protein